MIAGVFNAELFFYSGEDDILMDFTNQIINYI